MKILMLFIIFLFVGFFFIVSNQEIALNSQDNVREIFSFYGKWIDGLFANGKSVAGYVVKIKWLPE